MFTVTRPRGALNAIVAPFVVGVPGVVKPFHVAPDSVQPSVSWRSIWVPTGGWWQGRDGPEDSMGGSVGACRGRTDDETCIIKVGRGGATVPEVPEIRHPTVGPEVRLGASGLGRGTVPDNLAGLVDPVARGHAPARQGAQVHHRARLPP